MLNKTLQSRYILSPHAPPPVLELSHLLFSITCHMQTNNELVTTAMKMLRRKIAPQQDQCVQIKQ